MEAVVMKQLFTVILIVCWFGGINGNAVGHDSQLLLKSESDIIELFKSKGSWLRMVLLFSRDTSTNNQSHPDYSLVNGPSPESALTSVDTTTSDEKPPAPLTQTSTVVPKTTTVTTTPLTTQLTTPTPIKNCQTNFTLLGDQCYYVSSSIASWHNAFNACQDLDSDLAHPVNSEENSLIFIYFQNSHKEITSWWIGGTDELEEGKWVWSHDNSTLSYTDWYKSEPNGQRNENCAHIQPGYKWNDIRCNAEMRYLCQKLPF